MSLVLNGLRVAKQSFIYFKCECLCKMKVCLKLSEADSQNSVFDENEVDSLPLLPLGNAPCSRGLPQHNKDSIFSDLPSFLREDTAIALQRRISDAASVYQVQKTKETRPRFNTFDENFTVEIRRLRDRIDTRLHDAVAAEDLETIERLITSGVSPAALNLIGLTPLHLCIIHKLIRPFEVLLRYGSANVKDASGLSVLHVAVLYRWLPGVDAALAAGADVTAVCDASRPLLSQTRQRYKHIMYEDMAAAFIQTPIQIATKCDDITILEKLLHVAEQKGAVNCHNKRGQTPLYTAILNGNLEAVEILLQKGASMHNISTFKDSALHMAVRKPTILKYLLNVNANGLSYFSDHGYAPLHQAAYCNQPESVKLLLNKFRNIELKTNKHGGLTALHLAAKHFSNETAEVLLEMGANPNEVDDFGNTPLHIAAKTINKEVTALLLRKGAVLSAKDQEGNTALKIIATKFHDAVGFFEPVFDDFISTMGLHSMGTTVVCVNYEVLSRHNESRQINTVEEFVRCGLRKVLLHPFIESLLYLKWKQLLPIFYVLIMVYATFLLSFNIFVVNVFYCKDIFLNTDSRKITLKQLKNSIELPWFRMYGEWYYVLMALNYTSIILLGFQELFYIYLKRLRYFFILESWVKLLGLILAAGLPLAVHFTEIQAWQRHVACAALLLVWLQAMFLLSRFPGWGYYVLMFGKVAINMFKIFITSICLVVGFAFCFMIQFQSKSPFDGPISAIVKTLIMMSSEFDYEDLFGEQHDKQLQHTRTIVRLLFLVFVLFVAIVLVNFMIAVAVSDTKNLNIAGNISRMEKQVDLLSSLEVLVNSGPLARLFKKKYGGKTYHKKMYNSIKANRTWYVECSASVEMYPQVLPSALYKAIMDITRKKDECTMRNNLKITSQNKIDALYDAIIGKAPGRCDNQKDQGISSYWLRQTILKQNEKIHQLTAEIACIKEMLTHGSARDDSRDRSSY